MKVALFLLLLFNSFNINCSFFDKNNLKAFFSGVGFTCTIYCIAYKLKKTFNNKEAKRLEAEKKSLELQNIIDNKKTKILEAEKKCLESQKIRENLLSRNSTLQTELDKDKEKLANFASSDLGRMKVSLENVLSKNEDLKNKEQFLNCQINELNQKNKELQLQLQSIPKKCEKCCELQKELEDKESLLLTNELQNEEMRNEFLLVETNNKNQKNTIDKLRQEMEESNEKYLQLLTNYTSMKNKKEKLQEDFEKLQKTMRQLVRKVEVRNGNMKEFERVLEEKQNQNQICTRNEFLGFNPIISAQKQQN